MAMTTLDSRILCKVVPAISGRLAILRAHVHDADITHVRVLAANRGATPVEVQRNVMALEDNRKYLGDDANGTAVFANADGTLST